MGWPNPHIGHLDDAVVAFAEVIWAKCGLILALRQSNRKVRCVD